MSDCPVCRPDPISTREEDAFSTPVRMPGTRHRSSCPTLPRISPEDEARLRADLAEMDRARRRAHALSRDIVIGGAA